MHTVSLNEIERKIVVDNKGNPTDAIIPYATFMEFVETYGLDLTDDEKKDIREAEAERQSGEADLVSHDEIKALLERD